MKWPTMTCEQAYLYSEAIKAEFDNRECDLLDNFEAF